jgi:hypothetical protein
MYGAKDDQNLLREGDPGGLLLRRRCDIMRASWLPDPWRAVWFDYPG